MSSVPLSLTIATGLPRATIRRSSSRDPTAGQGDIGNRGEAFPGAVVIDAENAVAPPVDELVGDEVERPPVVRQRCSGHGRPTVATRANQTWAMDFVHDRLGTGRKLRVPTIVDTFSRF